MTTPKPLHEYVGAIHVHSVYSDGSGTVEEILTAAADCGLDFLALTDHNTLGAQDDGHSGRHGNVLLIVGDEVSGRNGHCIALGIDRHVDHKQPPSDVLQGIDSQGGLSFVAHPHGRYRPLFQIHNHSWQDWSADAFTGLELWSYMFDWARDFHYVRFPSFYRDPDARITGPEPETLAAWDRLCLQRRVVALGGVDAHARKYPLLPFVVFPYRDLFGTVRSHVLTRTPLPGNDAGDTATILDALREGHVILSFDRLDDAAGARFGSRDGSLITGDEAPFRTPIVLGLQLPRTARISIMRDGLPLHTAVGDSFEFSADAPGVYRAEARLDDRPWLYTNPIYLRAPA